MLYPKCCMEEEGRSLPEEATGAASTSRAEAQGSNPFTALIEELHVQQHKKLNLPEVSKVYDMLVDLGSETAGDIPPELHDTIRSVSIGFGFLAFDQLPDGKKAAFIHRLRRDRTYYDRDWLMLIPEQAEIVKRMASAVNIAYDPGQPEDETKRIFQYADFENRVPDGYEIHDP
jgi:hypothetical protein